MDFVKFGIQCPGVMPFGNIGLITVRGVRIIRPIPVAAPYEV
jgi:hypothetical protein